MKVNTKERGQRGEDLAAQYLEKNGYRIIDRNVQLTMGEIDLVVCNVDYLVFVEVKSGKQDDDFPAWIHFDQKKRNKYVVLAQAYLARKPSDKKDLRFDLISVSLDTEDIEHFENVVTLSC